MYECKGLAENKPTQIKKTEYKKTTEKTNTISKKQVKLNDTKQSKTIEIQTYKQHPMTIGEDPKSSKLQNRFHKYVNSILIKRWKALGGWNACGDKTPQCGKSVQILRILVNFEEPWIMETGFKILKSVLNKRKSRRLRDVYYGGYNGRSQNGGLDFGKYQSYASLLQGIGLLKGDKIMIQKVVNQLKNDWV